MKIIKAKPTSNSLRHHTKLYKGLIIRDSKIIKSLLSKKISYYGRSSLFGGITSWHKQRGKKKLFRSIKEVNSSSNGIVIGNIYDPNRSSLLSLCFDMTTKTFFSRLSVTHLFSGSYIQTSQNLNDIRLGYRTKLKNIPTGSIIHNLSKMGSSKSSYIKSAGVFGQIIQLDKKIAKIKLPSGGILKLSVDCYASLGSVSNEKHNLRVIGKAGRSRNLGRRPIVRGVAMNPVDHPHGGRTNGGKPSVTPWGLPTKGKFYLKKKHGKI